MDKDEFPVFMVPSPETLTGNKRVDRIKREYESKGFVVLTNRNFSSGIDLIVFRKRTGRVVAAIESTNYKNENEWIGYDPNGKKKMDRYIESLDWFDRLPNVKKMLYVSFVENLRSENDEDYREQLQRLHDHGIVPIIVGHQD